MINRYDTTFHVSFRFNSNEPSRLASAILDQWSSGKALPSFESPNFVDLHLHEAGLDLVFTNDDSTYDHTREAVALGNKIGEALRTPMRGVEFIRKQVWVGDPMNDPDADAVDFWSNEL